MKIEKVSVNESTICSQEIKLYKCIYSDCSLSYKSENKLKKHLTFYDHKFFKKDSTFLQNSNYEGLLDVDKMTERPIKEKDAIFLVDLMKSQNLEIRNLFSFIFKDGLLFLNDDYKSDNIFCRIPGCGKIFKSIMAYKYHMSNENHSLSKCIKLFMDITGENISAQFNKELLKMHKINEVFTVKGVSHHIYNQYDLFYPIKFTSVEKENIKERRTLKIKKTSKKLKIEEESDNNMVINNDDNSLPHKLMIDNTAYEFNSVIHHSNFKFIKINEEIKTMNSIKHNNKLLFFISTKEGFEPERMFNFSAHKSKLLILNSSFKEVSSFDFDYGFMRKMYLRNLSDTILLYALFNDGKIRKLSFSVDNSKYKIINNNELESTNISDYILLNNEIVYATDGNFIYKVENNKITNKSTKFNDKIIKLVIDEEKMIFYILNNCGHIFKSDESFSNINKIVCSLFLSNIHYFSHKEILCATDSFNYLTKFIDLTSNNNTSTYYKGASNVFESTEREYLLGDFDGSVRKVEIFNKKISFKFMFRVIKSKEFLEVIDNEVSIIKYQKRSIPFNYLTSVNSIIKDDSKVYVAYTCGLLVEYYYK